MAPAGFMQCHVIVQSSAHAQETTVLGLHGVHAGAASDRERPSTNLRCRKDPKSDEKVMDYMMIKCKKMFCALYHIKTSASQC